MPTLTFLSLFAGIGGIDLGLERAGHKCIGQIEIDPYCQKVLARHWPNVPRHDDIRTFHGSEFGPFDLLTGGYTCQPFSHAGKRAGEPDPRHLWPEVHRIIRNVRPRYALLENVPGHLSLGFGRVLGDLAESGYDAEWDCIPASAVGAPHRRDRLWIVAHPARNERNGIRRSWQRTFDGRSRQVRHQHIGENAKKVGSASGRQWRVTNDTGKWWAVEPDVGRMAHGVPNRMDRLSSLGNAVVPQVAELIGRRLPA